MQQITICITKKDNFSTLRFKELKNLLKFTKIFNGIIWRPIPLNYDEGSGFWWCDFDTDQLKCRSWRIIPNSTLKCVFAGEGNPSPISIAVKPTKFIPLYVQ